MELKNASTIKMKDKLMKKLKTQFGEGAIEEKDEEEEEEQGPGLLALTQGMGEYVKEVEDVEEKEVEEAPREEPKKRKAQSAQPKGKKKVKPSPEKPTTRANTRATTKAAKEKEKKKATKQGGIPKKKLRRKYVGPPESDEDRTELDDNNQFRVVSHTPKPDLENTCDNIRDNVDLSSLKGLYFNKFPREEQNMVEESIYTVMAKFKNTPLELENTMSKELYSIVENKWHYFLNMENDIRESTLACVILELKIGQTIKENKKNWRKFSSKYKAFNIIQNNMKDVENKSTLMWKVIYGITIVKEGQEDPFEGRNDHDEEEDEKEEEGEKEKDEEEVSVEKEVQKSDMATIDQQQQDQSLKDTQMSLPNPKHVTPTPVDLVIVQDVPDTSGQNVNPLTIEDLKKILHQITLQAQLCANLVLVSVEELQKVVAMITKEKVNPKDPPSHTKTSTSGQPQEKTTQDESARVDTTVTMTSTTEQEGKKKKGQQDTSITTTQSQGAPPHITIIDQGRTKENKEEIPKENEQEAIQTLINLPTIGTSIGTTQQLSTDAIPLQIETPNSSSTKVARVLHYGDLALDEEIIILRYDFKTMNIDQINEV